jgi:hypothetical protein
MILHVNCARQARSGAIKDALVAVAGMVEDGMVPPGLVARLRVHLDWIQYRRNFRETIAVRRAVNGRGDLLPLTEIAIDIRQVRFDALRPALVDALKLADASGDSSDQIMLEPAGPCRASIIWQFNRLFWHHLAAWEEVSGRSYEQSLPGGRSDANHPVAVADAVAEFWTLLKEMDERRQLPAEVFLIEIGVGTGARARLWLDRFRALDVERGTNFYPRLRFLLSDQSMQALDVAASNLREHRDVASFIALDALDPLRALSFLRYKVLYIHLTNVYDNLPTEELVRRDGRLYTVQPRAYLRRADAVAIGERFGVPPDDLPRTIARFLDVGPGYFADRRQGVLFWQAVWEALRLDERLVSLEDLPDLPLPAGVSFFQLEEILRQAPGDIRFHLSSGALESFQNTLPLLHPRGYLQVQDIFTADLEEYRDGFYGPGKLDGALVNWVNGALLREVGARAGYDVHFAPFRYREGSRTSILYTTQRE